MDSVTVKLWNELTPTEVYAIASLRTEVFLREQGCDDAELDWRDLESTTVHYFLQDAASPEVTAYLRTLRDGSGPLVIGRVATAPAFRGHGLASRLLGEVIARHDGEPMLLHAQTYATGLYAGQGFSAVGEEFQEAGIPHITMMRE